MNGEVLGDRYELLEKIGEGGMAVVYKARCNKLNRFVAVKILKDEYSDNEEIVKKFKKEATAIAKLSDNNIVNVLDVGTEGDINYIVMELVEGKTLKEVIGQFGNLNYDTAITIANQVAKALDCAHRNNIIHRDIKPQNILVTEEGLVKVTDFGIAKSSDSATLTNTSTILGSAHYFSPEQAKGAFIDERTDIYSLGIVMYEMVTGKLPFEADSPVTIALKHLQEEVVPPKELNNRVPESLNKVILKCMEKDADNRYQNVKELIADLQKIKANPDTLIGEEELQAQETAQHTIVMNAVKEPVISENTETNDLADEYYDDEYEDEDGDYYDEDEDEFDDRKKDKTKKKNKGLFIGIGAAIIVILLGVGAFFMFSGGSTSKKVDVPNFIGMTMDEANKAANALDLKVVKVKEVKNEAKTGTIIESNPTAGTAVDKGSTIEVTVSGGDKIFMPNVTEDSRDDAKNKLESLGLTNITINTDYSDDIPEGKVISQDPDSGAEVEKNTKVTLVVSKGKKANITIPNLVGTDKDSAKSKLQGLGLSNVNITEEYSDNIPEGQVISQDPSSGTQVEERTKVTLVVSKGKEVKKVTVPSVNGLTERAARDKLSALGFKVSVNTSTTTDKDLDGKVIDQDPSSGANAKEGDTITLQIGMFKEVTVDIMNEVSGMKFKDAVIALAKKNITASIADGYDENGTVVNSSPTTAKAGDSVTLKTDKKKSA
ncbi:Stk1 family PASTA domain-containing Ser/Thr kinase [Clostridium sp.]|uniref:Stk1 family PASTA domain-containing Ser/Thr kinase n=3 Tax=Clostridium sp. TaxID=1506 RepID=UPI002FCC72D2